MIEMQNHASMYLGLLICNHIASHLGKSRMCFGSLHDLFDFHYTDKTLLAFKVV